MGWSKEFVECMYSKLESVLPPRGEYRMGGLVNNKTLFHSADRVFFRNIDTSVEIDKQHSTIEIVDCTFAKRVVDALKLDLDILQIKRPRIVLHDDTLVVESCYLGYKSKTVREIDLIVKALELIAEYIESIKCDILQFVHEYNEYLKKISEKFAVKETSEKTEKYYSECYDNVYFPIRNDRQLRAVLRKILF